MIRLFRVFIPTSIIGLVISEILLVAACYVTAIWWQFEDPYFVMMFENGPARVAVVVAAVILGLDLNDCYTRVRMQSRLVFLQQLCLVIGAAFLLQACLSYANLEMRMPRQAMLSGSLACLILLPAWRTVYSKVTLQVMGAEKLLFVGTHPLQLRLVEHLREHREFAMAPVGLVVESEERREAAKGQTVMGTLAELPAMLKEIKCNRIIVGLSEEYKPQAIPMIISLQQSGYRTQPMSRAYETVFGRVAISQIESMQILFQESSALTPLLLNLQSVYSGLIAIACLVATWPLMLLTAIAVRLNSPGTILFRQTRTGRNNIPFTLYKFRSMYSNAEEMTGAVWAQENDPRVTAVGRFIRKYRLDELPQLFNVLRGEMSIVGPRPERPEFVNLLAGQIPFYMQRLAVKPGITGWAQINYRYGNTVEDSVVKLEYDLYYIKNFTPALDFYIMFHTLKTMLLTRGAY
jgi:exopolysaccharide biosynthesis polyprenyl glycosylphosphotransferase